MPYRIKVDYQTGDSFSNQDTYDYLDLSWNDLNIAKENLLAIQEHWKWYQEIESLRFSKETTYQEEFKDRWWMPTPASNSFNHHYLHHSMKLKSDSGQTMQQSNPWCGHFENLHGAEIEDLNLKFEV